MAKRNKTSELLIMVLRGLDDLDRNQGKKIVLGSMKIRNESVLRANLAHALNDLAQEILDDKTPRVEFLGNEQPHKRAVFIVE